MILRYFNENNNFGDQLNPFIFYKLTKDFFDNNENIEFFGIGSIIGLNLSENNGSKKIIFSSGFAYSKKNKLIDNTYDVACLRGFLSAKKLGLPDKLAIADGALLLKQIPLAKVNKEYPVSFMPHWTSERKYDWKKICDLIGIHYISPITNDIEFTINEIRKSGKIIAEAMHAAIVADAYGVPWIPLKIYEGINSFKWNDWLSVFNKNYLPYEIPSLFENNTYVQSVFTSKLRKAGHFNIKLLINIWDKIIQKPVLEKIVCNKLNNIKKVEGALCGSNLVQDKSNLLFDKLNKTISKYK